MVRDALLSEARSPPASSSSQPGADPSLALAAPVAAQAQAPVAQAAAVAVSPVTSQIAAQMVKSVSGKSTQFDIALHPQDMGQVNVKVQIDSAGQVSAALSFDNPHAAAEAKAHAGELQQALEQAGFNLSQGGLSFDVGGQGASLARQNSDQSYQSAQTASSGPGLADTTDIPTAAPTPAPLYAASGVNILI